MQVVPPAATSSEIEPERNDDLEDEIQFDPTVSSGHLGYRGTGTEESDYRNTPISVGGGDGRSSVTANLDGSYLPPPPPPAGKQAQQPEKGVEEMTPTEEENLLSSKLMEKR